MTPRRITTLCSKLPSWTDDPIPNPRKVYEGAIGARFPAHQVNGIWHFFEEDRDAILRGLGLHPKSAGHARDHRAAPEHAAA